MFYWLVYFGDLTNAFIPSYDLENQLDWREGEYSSDLTVRCSELARQILSRAHKQIAIETDGDEGAAGRRVMVRLCIVSGQDTRGSPRRANAAEEARKTAPHDGFERAWNVWKQKAAAK